MFSFSPSLPRYIESILRFRRRAFSSPTTAVQISSHFGNVGVDSLSCNLFSPSPIYLNPSDFYSIRARFTSPRDFAVGSMDARRHLQEIISADPKGGWEKAWGAGTTPWDLGDVTPAIRDFLASGSLPPGRRVLVPGCGTGYDVIAFARGGHIAVGLDISESAVESAKKNAAETASAENAQFVCQDFFSFSPAEPFDAVFDYTFFCAIQPAMRPDWAKKMAELVAPSGFLLTLMFPISDHEGGPPFAVSHSAYVELLEPLGFSPEDMPTISHPSREGKERLVKWTKKTSKF